MGSKVAQIEQSRHFVPNQERKAYPSSETNSSGIDFPLAITPIRLKAMEPFLSKYPDRIVAKEIQTGFEQGFPLHYSGPRKSFDAENLKSASAKNSVVREKIDKEVAAGRMEGPFDHPPFQNFRVSPLGLVPKKGINEYRLIHHLSYPDGESVNDFIDPKLCSVQYTKFDQAVEMIQRLGEGALLAKADIKSAFRLLPVAKADFELLGLKFKAQYFFDKALPFGCSISCATFEKFASFLQWVVRNLCSVGELEHYLDDFLFGGRRGMHDCQTMLDTFFTCCNDFGVPIADEKTEGPTTVLVFLGLELDSVLMQIRIPLDKITALIEQIQVILNHKRSMTLKELQSMVGSLNFMCRAVAPGRAFCRRLINATCGVTKPYFHIRITKGMRQDLETWLCFFRNFNGISMFQEKEWLLNSDACLFTDSSAAVGNGFGAYFQGRWLCEAWPEAWLASGRTNDIVLLEYFPILVSIYVWGEQLRNKKVLFRCDNKSVVQTINGQTSRSPEIMILVRALTLKSLRLNLTIRAEFIPGLSNSIADSLSRFQMVRFRELAPEAAERPEKMPCHLWSIFELEPDSF